MAIYIKPCHVCKKPANYKGEYKCGCKIKLQASPPPSPKVINKTKR